MPDPTLILIAVIAFAVLAVVALMFRALHIAASLVEQHSLDRQRSRPAATFAVAQPVAPSTPRRRRHPVRLVLVAAAAAAMVLWLLARNANAAVARGAGPAAVPAHANASGWLILIAAVLAAVVYIGRQVRKRR